MQAFIQLISDNKEWLFSGMGVAVISGIGALVVSKFRSTDGREITNNITIVQTAQDQAEIADRRGKESSPSTAHITRIAPLSFSEIKEALKNSPPLQERDIASRYVGLTVEWQLALSSASELDDGIAHLTLGPIPDEAGVIHCAVKLDEYKELGVMKRDAPIKVIGEIEQISAYEIHLKNAHLYFIGQAR